MIAITRRNALIPALARPPSSCPRLLRAQADVARPGPVTFVVGYAAGGGADIVARQTCPI